MDKQHIMQIQGSDFVKYGGLLAMAHEIGLKSIETNLVKLEHTRTPYIDADGKNRIRAGILVIFEATVTSDEGRVFHGYGDATDKNVNKMILPHLIRMAETRAKARALRDFTNVDMCSVEELGGDDNGL